MPHDNGPEGQNGKSQIMTVAFSHQLKFITILYYILVQICRDDVLYAAIDHLRVLHSIFRHKMPLLLCIGILLACTLSRKKIQARFERAQMHFRTNANVNRPLKEQKVSRKERENYRAALDYRESSLLGTSPAINALGRCQPGCPPGQTITHKGRRGPILPLVYKPANVLSIC